MFERTNLETGFENALERDGLRPLSWAELSARFAATHDLRRVFSARGGQSAGNFATFHSGAAADLNGNTPFVNLDALGEHKNNGSIMPDTASDVTTGDREL